MAEAHCEGETGRVVIGDAPKIPGNTMVEKLACLNGPRDDIRRFCVFEPRGHAAMSTNLLVPPCEKKADVGFVVMQPDRCHAMSGSNAICVATVILEMGIVEMTEPQSTVMLDTAAGLVEATASCKDGKCESIRLAMPPSFVEQLDVEIDVAGLGKVKLDVACCGIYYALVDAAQLGLGIRPENARKLVDAGSAIHQACLAKLKPRHPIHSSLSHLAYVMFTAANEQGELVNATVMPPGRIDRSPCGTGTGARLAALHARGKLGKGKAIKVRSIIGGSFKAKAVGDAKLGDKDAILLQITGRSWMHGIHRIGLDPTDPYPEGFFLSDTWGAGPSLAEPKEKPK